MPKLVLPLVALLAVGGSAAGASVYLLSRDETVVEVLPSPVALASPTATSAAEASPTPTAAPTATEVAGKAPDGCLPTELAYVDPAGRFAFCYPKDMELITTDEGGNGTGAIIRHPITDRDRVVATFGWIKSRSSGTGDPCVDADYSIIKNQTVADYILSGKAVPTCFQDRYALKEPDVLENKAVRMEVPAAGGGFVGILVVYGRPGSERIGVAVDDIAMRILTSTVVN